MENTKKCALVTGGTGFIGTYLSKKLFKSGWSVKILDIKDTSDLEIKKNCNLLLDDINNIDLNNSFFKDISVIFHLASIPTISRKNKNTFIKNNLDTTKKIVALALKNNISNLVCASSSTVYGIPKKFPLKEIDLSKTIGNYGYSKYLSEKYLIATSYSKINTKILRPRVVIGPGRLGIFSILFERIIKNKNIYTIGNGKNIFQFTNVNDFVDSMLLSSELNKSEIFNIGSDDKVNTYEILKNLIQYAKSNSKIRKIPSLIIINFLKILESLGLSPLQKEQYMIANKDFFLDTEKAKKILNWRPKFTTQQTLNDTFDWYKENSSKNKNQIKSFGLLTKFKNFQQGGFQK